MDMEMSDDEEEDGQISKFEQEEEREQRLVGKGKTEEETATLDDLTSCQLTRDLLCRYSKHPWFEDYAKGELLDQQILYVEYLSTTHM